jgi:hypothetical protein
MLKLLLVAAFAVAGAAEPEVAQLSFDARFPQTSTNGLPAWIVGVSQQGGSFTDDPKCWHVPATQPVGTGRLAVRLDRRAMQEDLALTVLCEPTDGADLVVQLFDADDRVIVLDLFANLVVVGREAKTDTFVVPLRKYPAATKVVVRRIRGDVKVFGMALMPVVGEAAGDAQTLQELARLLGDPLSPDNPLVKGVASIAARNEVPVEWIGQQRAAEAAGSRPAVTSRPANGYWEVLPFPRNSDWPGRRGEPSVVGAGELVLQGQPIRFHRVLTAPATIEWDVQLEQRAADDGSFDLHFIPEGMPKDVVPRPATKFRLIYSNTGDFGSVDRLEIDQNGVDRDEVLWSHAPFEMEAGRAYHVVLTVDGSGRLTAAIDGRSCELPKELVVPHERFQIQLLGWQPTNRWHVRNFGVR